MVIGRRRGARPGKIKRNFGMPRPEGYRKALRLMEMAERFKMPIITFIDTRAPILAWVPKSAASPRRLPAT